MQHGCQVLCGFLHGIEWIMFHGHLDYFPKPPLGGRSNTKPGHHGTPNVHRLRAHDHYASSTLIDGNGRSGPSSLHTTLEGPAEHVNATWRSSLCGFLHSIEWIMFHGHLDYFPKPPLVGRSNTKPGDHGAPNNVHNR